jgi:hypothetical protein
MTDLRVEAQDDEITVTEPGTDLTVMYKKWADQPNLVMTHASFDPTLRTTFEFKARAWIAANDKARELGWIV